MSFYSPPDRAYPQVLPDRWKFEDGTVRTDLKTLSDDELNALGWVKIDMPTESSYFTHDNNWNAETLSFVYTEIDTDEKERRVSYIKFWDILLDTSVYQTLKTAASLKLSTNVLLTEFIALLDDAKRGYGKRSKIQESITAILADVTLSLDELAELQTVFNSTGMSSIYTLT